MLDETTTGHALRRLRELSGLSERRAARAIGVRRSELRSWESQDTMPDDEHLARAVGVYGRDLQGVVATRRPLTDPERPGLLLVGEEEIVVAEHVRESDDPHHRNEALLRTYVDAVRRQRGVPLDQAVELRADDLNSLATELDLEDDHLRGLLGDLLDLTPAGAQFATRALLVGALIAVLSTGAVQSTWLAPTASASTATAAVPAVVTEHTPTTTPTFWAGDLGPTERGATFTTADPASATTAPGDTADTSNTADSQATRDHAVDVAPPAPHAEVTPDDVPYTIFSVEPIAEGVRDSDAAPFTDPPFTDARDVERERATDLANSTDGSTVFSVTPRGNFSGSTSLADETSGSGRPGPAALPPGSPALPPGD